MNNVQSALPADHLNAALDARVNQLLNDADRFRFSFGFALLLLSLTAFSWAGWVVIGGMLPLYLIPLTPLVLRAVLTKSTLSNSIERRFNSIFAFFCFFTFLAVPTAFDPGRALLGSLGWPANLALIYATAYTINGPGRWRAFMLAYILLQAISFGFAIPQFLWGTFFISPAAYENQVAGLEAMSYSFGKNYLPLFSFGVCALSYETLLKRRHLIMPVKVSGLIALLVAFLAIAISESRSSQMAILLGCAVAGWRAGLLSGANLKAVLLAVVFLLAGIYFGEEKWSKVLTDEGLHGDGSFLYRLTAWDAGLRIAFDNWFSGVGMGNYRYHVADYLYESMESLDLIGILNAEGEVSAEVHNVFIGIAAMAGIPAMILFTIYYFQLTLFTWRVSKKQNEVVELRFVALVTSLYLITYLVSLNMHNLFNDNVPWVIIGAFFGVYRRINRTGLLKAAAQSLEKSPCLQDSK